MKLRPKRENNSASWASQLRFARTHKSTLDMFIKYWNSRRLNSEPAMGSRGGINDKLTQLTRFCPEHKQIATPVSHVTSITYSPEPITSRRGKLFNLPAFVVKLTFPRPDCIAWSRDIISPWQTHRRAADWFQLELRSRGPSVAFSTLLCQEARWSNTIKLIRRAPQSQICRII